ncbi:hypothetical protein [Microbacterium ulmi]|uniref:Uncharacterized protein n=1 Tax=Microbacterium ulmi TaxID=179095 RepID=A0A7Y2M234_9MICO|nr:hypothetical protein [Microbacterium ulmi]NII70099.1 hypothetical protein [Microbacterium ulmi]NNH04359.1 hypothetical protein [Microbacterium ulmi]
MTSGPDASPGAGGGVADDDEATLVVGRQGRDADPHASRAAADDPADPTDDDPAPADPAAADPAADADAPDVWHAPAEPDAETGSTMVVRRESRRRAEAAARDAETDLEVTIAGAGVRPLPPTVAGDVPAPLGRVAHAPTPAEPVYAARRTGPAIVPRSSAPPHALQVPVDGAASDLIVRRRSRRRAIVVVAAASIVLVAAVVALVLLAFAS